MTSGRAGSRSARMPAGMPSSIDGRMNETTRIVVWMLDPVSLTTRISSE